MLLVRPKPGKKMPRPGKKMPRPGKKVPHPGKKMPPHPGGRSIRRYSDRPPRARALLSLMDWITGTRNMATRPPAKPLL